MKIGKKNSTLTLDELYGILITCELRIGRENHCKEEVTFKVLKKTKAQKSKLQSISQEESYDEEESNFIRNSRKVQGSIKENYLSNALTMGRLDISKTSVPILKWIIRVKEP